MTHQEEQLHIARMAALLDSRISAFPVEGRVSIQTNPSVPSESWITKRMQDPSDER